MRRRKWLSQKISLLRNNYFSIFPVKAHHLFFFLNGHWSFVLDIKCVIWRIMLQIEFGKSFQNIGKNFPSMKYVLIFCLWIVFIVLKPKESLCAWMQNVAIAKGRKLTGLGRWLGDKAPAVQTCVPMIPRTHREPDTVVHVCDSICNLSASTKRWGKAAAGGCTREWTRDPSTNKAGG